MVEKDAKAISSLRSRAAACAVCISVLAIVVLFYIVHNQLSHAKKSAANTSGATSAPILSDQQSTVKVSRLQGATTDPAALTSLGDRVEQYMKLHSPGSSVYLEDLTDHISVSSGKTKQYNAKSLMKVPLVMTMYRAAELNRLNLNQTVAINSSELDPAYGDLYLRGSGAMLTLREAATVAMQKSDNTAIHVVSDNSLPVMPNDDRAYIAMNLDTQTDSNKQTYITARSYSTVFRCLYTACYLNREDSDELLTLMEKTAFNDPSKLLPKNIVVTHKVGDGAGSAFNDCGIVFSPKKPFIFCIMTTENHHDAANDISQIVKLAYDFLAK